MWHVYEAMKLICVELVANSGLKAKQLDHYMKEICQAHNLYYCWQQADYISCYVKDELETIQYDGRDRKYSDYMLT